MSKGTRSGPAPRERRFAGCFPRRRAGSEESTGNLADRLDKIADEARGWSFPPRDQSVSTFGVNVARDGVLPKTIDVGAMRWAVNLTSEPFKSNPWAAAANPRDVLSLFPVVYGDILLVNTADQILAWNIRTGKPAWPAGQGEGAVIYSPVAEATTFGPIQYMGTPRYTMTVADGRLFARMGAPVTSRASNELRESDSQLVCLDLQHNEGKLLWKVESTSLDGQGAFEGSPLVVGGRAYVVVRKGRPQLQTEIVCFDAESGRRLWNRPVCAAIAHVGQNDGIISHELLTAGDDALYLSTGSGAIAAMEKDGSSLRWVVTYESEGRDSSTPLRESGETSPCLFAQNMVFAAPNDFNGVMAIDSRCGLTLWRQSLPGGVEHLLGEKNGVLIASGKSLWGLELSTGLPLWHVGFTDPVSFGYGRGILAGDAVYWPTREDIFVVDQATGTLRQRIPLLARDLESGGNLMLAGDSL